MLATVWDAEKERCDAISHARWSDLAALLDDDLTHTHVSGKTEGKTDYLENLKAAAPRTLTRYDLTVKELGNVAVMTGRQLMKRTAPDGTESLDDFQVLEVWVKRQGDWRLLAFQSSGVPRSR